MYCKSYYYLTTKNFFYLGWLLILHLNICSFWKHCYLNGMFFLNQFYCVQLLVFLVYFYRLWNCSTIIPNLMGKLFCSWMEIAPCWSAEKSIIRDAMQFWTFTGFNFALQFRWAVGETLFSPTFQLHRVQ